LVLVFLTAFLGYVLPWGQMSFWAATVITNTFTVISTLGEPGAQWLWGGFNVGQPTLTRFFTLHLLIPFLILLLSAWHMLLLHSIELGSSNPLSHIIKESIKFNPYYSVKDIIGFVILSISSFFLVFFSLVGHDEN